MNSAIKNSLIVSVLFVLISCGNAPDFDKFKNIASPGWHQDSLVSFELDITDTASYYLPSLKLRHDGAYPYANIYLFRKITSSTGTEYQDTVNLTLAEPTGKWLGEGVGEVKLMKWQFSKSALRFTKLDTYTFSFQQGMRDTILPGIMDVGIEINKLTTEEIKNGNGEK